MTEHAFHARRQVRTYRQTINAAPDVVFPLLCPVRETEWLDGWQNAMIYSASGQIEEGAVFSTFHAGEDETIWLVTRHDPASRRVDFARFTPQSRICFLTIAVSPSGEGCSHVDISYTYTSVGPAGDQFLKCWTEEKFREAGVFWEKSMNHFLETGTRLSHHTENRVAKRMELAKQW